LILAKLALRQLKKMVLVHLVPLAGLGYSLDFDIRAIDKKAPIYGAFLLYLILAHRLNEAVPRRTII
jgi:hypothetical protein